ncbi:MAG: DUF2461 domain-containing protein [Deltaproteobacteria bacterium]|nr:DUF2461 domain-containing protein [Deltaproteobacteria bacterium]
MVKQTAFTGFTPNTLEFMRALAANNRKEWFEAHKDEYRRLLQEPLQQLAAALAGPLAVIDPDLIIEPRRVVSRIYRDTRFSRDKSPYKTTMWLTYKRPLTAWQDAPAYFFEVAADSYRFGMGFYSASKGTMDRLRVEVEQRPERFRQAVAFLGKQDTFVLEGDLYKRVLKPDLADDLQGWHMRKNLYLVCNRQADKVLFTQGLADDLRKGFFLLAPFYGYLAALSG